MDCPEYANVTLAMLRIPFAGLMCLKRLSRSFDEHKTAVPEELRRIVVQFVSLTVLEQSDKPLIANHPTGWGDWGCVTVKHGMAIAERISVGYKVNLWTSTGSPVSRKIVPSHGDDNTYTGTTFFVADSCDDCFFAVSYCEFKHLLRILKIPLDVNEDDGYEKIVLRWKAARHHPVVAVKKCHRFIFVLFCGEKFTLNWIDVSYGAFSKAHNGSVILGRDMPKAFDVRMNPDNGQYEVDILSSMSHYIISLSETGSLIKQTRLDLEGFKDVLRATFTRLCDDLICIHRERANTFPPTSELKLASLCPGSVEDIHSMSGDSRGQILKIIRRSATSVFIISFKYN
ncbi:hypothetical protein FOL47_007429 [Perkinsus chesapeaki]|uniref:Uncharacterized protein n=1 Tax=Perkinsus chesapeaki TaxID=330153 RepID=A0A7J6MWD2_PERCH|nr:hypothetical protein FOL47_007429 [Perkinsus chesapeaki]